MTKQRILKTMSGGTAAVLLTGVIGIGSVSAAAPPSHTDIQQQNDDRAWQTIENKSDDQYRRDLDREVNNRRITSHQRDLLLEKHRQLKQLVRSNEGRDTNQRRNLIEQERGQLRQWSQQNSVPTDLVIGDGVNP